MSCYKVLGLVHKFYTPVNYKFKDYISVPKTNMYRSLHTTVFGPDQRLIQIQIKTKEMDDINILGLASYWKKYREKGYINMQETLLKNYQFMNTLTSLNEYIKDDKDFVEIIKNEIFANNIYVYTANGDIIELPNSATPIDFAYKINPNIGNHISTCFVNGKEVKINYKLKNKDRVMIIIDESVIPKKEWENIAVTMYAKKEIIKYLENIEK